TDVLVQLKAPPQAVFQEGLTTGSNYIRFRLSPEQSISVGARVKNSGEEMTGHGIDLIAHHRPADEMPPYERRSATRSGGICPCSRGRTASKPPGASSIRFWETRHLSSNTSRTHGDRSKPTS